MMASKEKGKQNKLEETVAVGETISTTNLRNDENVVEESFPPPSAPPAHLLMSLGRQISHLFVGRRKYTKKNQEEPVHLVDEENDTYVNNTTTVDERERHNRKRVPIELEDNLGDEWRKEYNHPRHNPDRFRHSLPVGMVLPEGVSQRHFEHDHHMLKLSTQISKRWGNHSVDRVERRLRDFYFAQNRRHEKYGNSHPWGVLGLYAHLSGIRDDVEWAEDTAWRRENDEPYYSWADWDDQNDHSWWNKPFFTSAVLLICTGTLIWGFYLNGWTIEDPKTNPMIGPSAETLITMGGKLTALIVDDGEWWRIVSPMVLHAGLVHYLVNMMALWFIGSAVEHAHGSIAVAIHFVLPATFGTILSVIFIPDTVTVGASGGIFGLMGACIADIVTNWSLLFSKQVNVDGNSFFRHLVILIILILDIAINCIIGFTPFVDNFNHMGGLVMGFLCGLTTGHHLSRRFFGMYTDCFNRLWDNFVRFSGMILSVIALMISVVTLAEMDSTETICTKCRYISCVPFPFWLDYEDQWWYCDDCDKLDESFEVTKNVITGFYETIKDMRCPGDETISVDISNYFIAAGNEGAIIEALPSYCREFCENKLKPSVTGF